jgi:putative membrane protein
MRALLTSSGVMVLAGAWLGPLPALSGHSFAAHMAMHMAVVAVAAPLIARGLAGTPLDPVRHASWRAGPIAASLVELVVVWGWHAPSLHALARTQPWALVLEQATFLAAGFWLWAAALGGGGRRSHEGAGIVALLLTTMHMTLLGALFAMASRPLFAHAASDAGIDAALADQHLGGAIMLLAGGTSYLAGGLWLTGRLLRASVMRNAVPFRSAGERPS